MLKRVGTILMVSFSLACLAPAGAAHLFPGTTAVAEEVSAGTGGSGQPEGGAVPGQKEVKKLSLEDALQLAEENNSTLKSAKLAQQKAYLEANQGYDVSRSISTAVNLSTAQAKYVQEERTRLAKTIADKSLNVAKEQVKLMVKKYYYAVLQARDIVKVDENALERAQKQLENAEAAFNVGTAAKTDVLSAQVGLANAQAQLTAAKNDYQLAVINLNKAIGLDLDTPLELTTSVEYRPPDNIDLAKTIDEAMTTRLDMASAEVNKQVAEKSYEIAANYTSAGTYVARLAELDIKNAELKIEDTKNQVVSDITQAYLNIQAANDTVKFMNTGVEQANENFRLTLLRYQVGMATMLNVLDASVQLADMQAKQVKALYSYDLARLAFETAKLAPLSGVSGGGSSAAATTSSGSASSS